ncbi:hypothetical protein PR048_009335 [Dryococelus australis]|uniref:Uncharacterized protein n=1 Tax=Dryococelus australis TaxID=614101 RepID=A0ABQ9HZL1_9NEOP|nr:hypothetical protein PR048_009335 [Dryococelus australis]
MLRSCAANACHRYISYLEEQKLAAKTTVKRKNYQDGEEIENLKKKFKQIAKDIASLTRSADELAQKAEDHGDMTLIASSNALLRTAKEKTTQLDNLKKTIASLECP